MALRAVLRKMRLSVESGMGGQIDTWGEARGRLPVRGPAVAELSPGLDQRLRLGAHCERADGEKGSGERR